MAESMTGSMAGTIHDFLKSFEKVILQFDYESHGFPLEKFETKAEAIASLGEISKRIAEKGREKGKMLEKVQRDKKFCERIMEVLKKLES